jgi:Lrp/AsnC family leucine-responsive transcriptional regulator
VARQVGLAPSAVLERIRKLEKKGIIDGYEVRLNPERFKKSLVAFIFIWINPSTPAAAAGKALSGFPEIQEVHFVAGEDCFLVKARVADTRELEDLLQNRILAIETVGSVKTHIVLSTQKETSRIPLDEGCLLD